MCRVGSSSILALSGADDITLLCRFLFILLVLLGLGIKALQVPGHQVLGARCVVRPGSPLLSIPQLDGSEVEIRSHVLESFRHELEASITEVLREAIKVSMGLEGFLEEHPNVKPSLTTLVLLLSLFVQDAIHLNFQAEISFFPCSLPNESILNRSIKLASK